MEAHGSSVTWWQSATEKCSTYNYSFRVFLLTTYRKYFILKCHKVRVTMAKKKQTGRTRFGAL